MPIFYKSLNLNSIQNHSVAIVTQNMYYSHGTIVMIIKEMPAGKIISVPILCEEPLHHTASRTSVTKSRACRVLRFKVLGCNLPEDAVSRDLIVVIGAEDLLVLPFMLDLFASICKHVLPAVEQVYHGVGQKNQTCSCQYPFGTYSQ